MRAAWFLFVLGSGLIYGLGTRFFLFTWQDAARLIFAANVGAFVGLFAVLWLESKPWIKNHLIPSVSRTWVAFLIVSYGIALTISPQFRPLKQLAILSVPAMLSTGFSVLCFGPLRDHWLRKSRRN